MVVEEQLSTISSKLTTGADQELKVRRAVRERYGALADRSGTCCETCSNIAMFDIPEEAVALKSSCGSPLELVSPKPGETVLDLGSGGGIDVFRASKIVGANGKVIGVDATPEMIWQARETARKHGYANVEFRLGEIEALPIESRSVDYIISNCVINLSPDKQKVFHEAYRVLKNGGTFAVADITSEREIPNGIKENVEVWSSCASGAITRARYVEQLKQAGFVNIEIKTVSTSADVADSCCKDGTKIYQEYGIKSAHILARKL
jgi:arsenite methyltransferase